MGESSLSRSTCRALRQQLAPFGGPPILSSPPRHLVSQTCSSIIYLPATPAKRDADSSDGTTLYLYAFVAVLLVMVLVIAALLGRAWHYRRLFRAELEHAWRTGAPEPAYRNPFLGTRYAPRPPEPAAGVAAEVPILWDEEMCLEPLPYSELGDGPAERDLGEGWAKEKEKGKAVVRVEPRDSVGSASSAASDDDWLVDAVQPAALSRLSYVSQPPAGRVPTTQPPFSQEMREALLAFIPRKPRFESEEEVVLERPRVRSDGVRTGEEVGLGVLIAMPRPGEARDLEGVPEVSLGVLECRAV